MKSKDEIKESIITYINSDIATLGEQYEEKEAMAYLNRIRAEIGMIHSACMISASEAKDLEDELGKARKKAEKNILDNKSERL